MTTPQSTEAVDRKKKILLPPQFVPFRSPEVRIHDYDPIVLDFDAATAIAEADRCIDCPKQPCVVACPIGNDIPLAMRLISQGQFVEAAQVYHRTSTLPEICSRVCPQENLCEGACVLGKRGTPVALGTLERFVTDYARINAPEAVRSHPGAPTGKSIAVIGTGPAGMSTARRLLEMGHAVTLYEAWPYAGGWMTYTIPTYKLPRPVLKAKIDEITALGGHWVFNTRVGVDVSLADLRRQYDAVFIGVGAAKDPTPEFPGADLPGVYSGTDFLLPVYTPPDQWPDGTTYPQIGAHVVVFGGGDTAMDCVRTAIRMQVQAGITPNVTLMYRRTQEEMPASHKEQQAAHEEGVRFEYLVAPVSFQAGPDGHLGEAVVQRMVLGEPDSSGRHRPVPLEGSEYTVRADMVILALGYWPDPLLSEQEPALESRKHGLIVVDQATGATTLPGVFSGGDAVRGPNLVSCAVHDGAAAARAIHAYVMGGGTVAPGRNGSSGE